MMNKAVKMTLGLMLLGSLVFAQNLTDARKAIDAEQYQKGKAMLNTLTSSQPTNPENFFYLGNLYLSTASINIRPDYIDSAKAVFEKGISANAEYALNFVGLGAVDLAKKANPKANFDKAIALTKKKDHLTDLYIGRAYVNLTKPMIAEAMVHLNKAKLLNEKDAQLFLVLGDAYRSEMKNSEAFSAYRTAFDLDKTFLRSKIELGKINKMSKAFEEAIAEFNSVIALDANYGPAYRELAETFYQWAWTSQKEYEGRIKQALQSYEKYMDLTDRSLDSRLRHADFLYLAKDFKALEAEANEMAKLDKVNPRVLRYLAYSSFENGNFTSSTQALKDFIAKVEPTRLISQDFLYLGRAQMKDTTQFQEGLANIEKAVALDSTNAVVMSEIGQALYKGKKYVDAARAYEIAIKNPERALLDYYYLGMSYYFTYGSQNAAKLNPPKDLLVKADTAFSFLVKRSPTTQAGWQYRGRINRLLDENDAQGLAVPFYETYVKLVTIDKPELAAKSGSGLIEAYNYLGSVALRKEENKVKAKEYFEKILVLDPANATAKEVLTALGSNN
ncbi:tetratricopeptide repeat protein [Daejeonella sp.]|jgi:tetratricopeptide (TPR) repeat protein|uniref:tetratricopeptide repeat protein n=1 Tax=Daejeonella sp. TaxID=2805397 RepID=UPI0037BEA2FD